MEKKDAALYSELFDGHIGTVLAAARDENRRALVEQALILAKAAQARDSYAAAVLLAGYEKDKAGALSLIHISSWQLLLLRPRAATTSLLTSTSL